MLEIGQPAPEFSLKDSDGNEVALSSFKGKSNVVLVFYPLAFTGICTGELKSLTANAGKYAEKNAKVLGISVDSRYALDIFKKKEGFEATLLADFHPKGDVAKKYGVFMDATGFAKRGTFVVDKAGILRGITINEPGQARDEQGYFDALASCPL